MAAATGGRANKGACRCWPKCPTEVQLLRAEVELLHDKLWWIACDNSPHDAQAIAERWVEATYGEYWWKKRTRPERPAPSIGCRSNRNT